MSMCQMVLEAVIKLGLQRWSDGVNNEAFAIG